MLVSKVVSAEDNDQKSKVGVKLVLVWSRLVSWKVTANAFT